jgi:hypothetical protein
MSGSLTGGALLPRNIFIFVSGTHFSYNLQGLVPPKVLGESIKFKGQREQEVQFY